MKKLPYYYAFLTALFCVSAFAQNASKPIASKSVIFGSKTNQIVIEAEHFYKQTLTSKRAWYINSPQHQPLVWPDFDKAIINFFYEAKWLILPIAQRL